MHMNIRRVVLDVDKSLNRPSLVELAAAIEEVPGVEALNISVTEMDMETMGTNITVEGSDIDYNKLIDAIEDTGAAIHSVDELAVGRRLAESVRHIE